MGCALGGGTQIMLVVDRVEAYMFNMLPKREPSRAGGRQLVAWVGGGISTLVLTSLRLGLGGATWLSCGSATLLSRSSLFTNFSAIVFLTYGSIAQRHEPK
jgi:hypothetical protein